MSIISRMHLCALSGAAAVLTTALAPVAAHAEGYFDCTPIQVIERSNRIDVQCDSAYPVGIDILAIDWISFVTFPKTDVPQMERFIDFATKALIEGKYFRTFVPDDSSGNLNGCLADNCRTVTTPFSIKQP
jgi:hypothetical protein